MSSNPRAPVKSRLEFEVWKLCLRKDCEAQGKLVAFDSIGDYTLKLLWEDGLDPSVEGIVGSSNHNQKLD